MCADLEWPIASIDHNNLFALADSGQLPLVDFGGRVWVLWCWTLVADLGAELGCGSWLWTVVLDVGVEVWVLICDGLFLWQGLVVDPRKGTKSFTGDRTPPWT